MWQTSKEVLTGHRIYTSRTLAFYDSIVLSFSNELLWQCPTRKLLDQFNKYVSNNHLDIGVGSGFFLNHCNFPTQAPRIGLMDLNTEALKYTAARISHYHPEIYVQNILDPIVFNQNKFDSISMNYLLHCLPGPIDRKSVVFDHINVLANPGALYFGATILNSQSWAAKKLMAFYNKRGIFSNSSDTVKDLEEALEKRFSIISFEIIGCVALFCGRINSSI